MFRKSIKQKIVGIAAGLIVLAVITSILSMVMSARVGHLLNELTNRYVPAYGDLARANIKSLERGLALRQMIIAKLQTPPDDAAYAAHLKTFQSLESEIEKEAQAARAQIDAIIADPSTPSNDYELGRLDDRIDVAVNDLHRRLDEQDQLLLKQLDARDFDGAKRTLAQADALREEFGRKIDAIRADMLTQVHASATTVIRQQNQAIIISAVVTGIAAVLGFVFAMLVGSGITGPVLRLLEGTREVEAGRLDHSISVTTGDEIGLLSAAFNRMIERLRQNQRIREVFGRYVDPRVAEGLLDQTALAAAEGQRRVMTVMFCDMKGFTTLSEGVTPQGLVKIMNLYLSTMSEPIHAHRGVIDKYIGDAIMAYWGAPFIEDAEQARLACLAAVDMIGRVDEAAQGSAGAARRARDACRLRHQDRHCDRRGAGRQHRLRIHDELHRDGRQCEPRLATGRREQVLRLALPDLGSDRESLRRRGRVARDRSRGGDRPDACRDRLRDHGPQGRAHAGATRGAKPLCRGARGLPCAALG